MYYITFINRLWFCLIIMEYHNHNKKTNKQKPPPKQPINENLLQNSHFRSFGNDILIDINEYHGSVIFRQLQ